MNRAYLNGNELLHHAASGTNRQPAPAPAPVVSSLGLAKAHRDFNAKTREAGLDFGANHVELTATFLAALATKPFVIFSGLSGSGKTRLASALGQWFGREHLLVQPVRPDWTSPEAVLGFENTASESHDAQHAWQVPRTLEFILSAVRDPEHPYLLVFDEMNLAHVEQYFADVLSGMESGQPVVPNLQHDGRGWRMPRKDAAYLPWPDNLFLVGTINLDETTYRFSPKVLDRAISIEFRVQPGSLKSEYPAVQPLRRADEKLLKGFMQAARSEEPQWQARNTFAGGLQNLHQLLFEYDSEFGHRVFRESLRFGALLADAGFDNVRLALDLVLMYKVLPRLDTPESMPDDFMCALSYFAKHGPGQFGTLDPLEPSSSEPLLPRSFGKLRRIARSRAKA